MRAVVLCKIPYAHAASTVTGNDLALVWVDDYIVDRGAMGIASLDRTAPGLPDFDCAIFRACDHPFSFAVKCDACDIACMAFECEKGVWVCGFDVVEFDSVMTSSGKEAFVGGDTEAVDLGIRMLDRSRADAREGFPEAGWRGVSRASKADGKEAYRIVWS
jgi:hypothetical protein